MIRRLSGKIVDVLETAIIIETYGVGYMVTVPRPTTYPLDEMITVHTHQAVRETALDLYGFNTRDELAAFELLLTIPKIGPKSAAGIMAQADITLLQQAVREADPSYLSKMSGIGKKTAENIVLGLKDKLHIDLNTNPDTSDGVRSTLQTDVIDALITLGYPANDARDAANRVTKDAADANEAIKLALQLLS